MPTIGSGQFPYPNSSAVPDVPADVLLLAQRVDLMSSGWAVCADAAARAALVTNGDAYEGLHVYQIDTKVAYIYQSLVWVPDVAPVNRQIDTTDDVVVLVPQVGIGMIAGAAAVNISEAVTFPVAYKSGTFPVVVVTFAGQASGAFNPAGAGTTSGVTARVVSVGPTGFTVYIDRDSNLSTGTNYYYSWIAYGEPA